MTFVTICNMQPMMKVQRTCVQASFRGCRVAVKAVAPTAERALSAVPDSSLSYSQFPLAPGQVAVWWVKPDLVRSAPLRVSAVAGVCC